MGPTVRFVIVVALWRTPAEWLRWTLDSIAAQKWPDFDVCVALDEAPANPEAADVAREFGKDFGWLVVERPTHYGSVRNQYEAIHQACSDPEEVVVWVDGDGDQLAHPHVLERLSEWYKDGLVLTYGSYQPFPPSATSVQAQPYPQHVINENRFREYARFGGGVLFNHLRTMKYRLIQQMDQSDFKEGDEWLQGVADSAFMFPGLELAKGRFACIPEVLLKYHADHQFSEWKAMVGVSDHCNDVILRTKAPK